MHLSSNALALVGVLARLSSAELKDVFVHYMVGGMSDVSQAEQDVTDAQVLNIDAFALNVQDPTADWSLISIDFLFTAAKNNGFKLFFSLDMNTISGPGAALDLVNKYVVDEAYYMHDGRPFLSTFNGGKISADSWAGDLLDKVQSQTQLDVYFVPDFDDWNDHQGFDASFFQQFGNVVDGAFSWETSWPTAYDGGNVTSELDGSSLAAAHDVEKTYMMPVSSLQFKHIDAGQNWYRRGELNLVDRMAQALTLQPDFIELLTWNDCGESHHFGNVWPEAISTAPQIVAYSENHDHNGWRHIIAPFISAYKNGATSFSDIVPYGAFASAFWYRGILVEGKDAKSVCGDDTLGFPDGAEHADDAVNVVVLLPADTTGVSVVITSGGAELARFNGVPGLNSWSVPGLKAGAQKVEILGANGTVMGVGQSTVDVVEQSNLCNFNYHVVHVA